MRHLLFLLAVAGAVVVLQACSSSDSLQPEPPTADFTISTSLPSQDLMTLEQTLIFWESFDDSVTAAFPVKLEAVHDHADTYEWYIHTDPTPTATGPVYISGFSLAGLRASEWPVTIRARLVASWAVGSDSVAKDTVDRHFTIYDHQQNFTYTYLDTIRYTGEHNLPPYMGKYKGYLTSDPEQELIVDIRVTNFGPWLKRGTSTDPCVFGLPEGCDDIKAALDWKTDRHFTITSVEFYTGGSSTEVCGHYAEYHGEYNPYTEQLNIRFGYDVIPRPDPGDRRVYEHRMIDEFIGTKIQ